MKCVSVLLVKAPYRSIAAGRAKFRAPVLAITAPFVYKLRGGFDVLQ